MALRKYDLSEAGTFVDLAARTMREAAVRGLYSAAQRTVGHIVTEVIPAQQPHMPIDRGLYKTGWRAEKLSNGALVTNNVPHAAFIEYGVKNVKIGRALIDALTEWVRRKGIGGTTRKSETGAVLAKRPSSVEARQIAWAIAKSLAGKVPGKPGGIFNHGQGLRIFETAQKQIPKFIREEVTREISRAFGGGG